MKTPVALIAGGRGFIGKAVVQAFRHDGFDTYTVGVPRAGDNPRFHLSIEIKTGESLAEHMERLQPSVILNLAAAPPNADSETHQQITIRFTEHLLEAFEHAAPSAHFIHLGSAAEYGKSLFCGRPLMETDRCLPFTAYGRAKFASSQRVIESHRKRFLATVARLFTAVGPGMPVHTLLGRVASELLQVKEEGAILKIGNLKTFRDYLDVREVARMLVQLSRCERALPPVMHLCSGVAQETGTWVNALISASGKRPSLQKDSTYLRARDPEQVIGSTELMKTFGLYPSPPNIHSLAIDIMNT